VLLVFGACGLLSIAFWGLALLTAVATFGFTLVYLTLALGFFALRLLVVQ
jgi:hypothetical protein